jgi:hypothetical protein
MRVAGPVLILAALLGCPAGSTQNERPSPGRGLILISLDTVSAEHLSLYGYARATTPFLDSLAPRATVFDNAFVQLPGTLPSHMSMFTGLYPDQHDVFPPDSVLAPGVPTIPEVLKAAGFRTIGHTDGGFVSGRFGFSRGFDEFNDRRIILWTKKEHTFARGLRSLRGLQPNDRFFLFIHSYAAHDPYTPPKECRGLFWQGAPPPGAKLSESAVLTAHNSGKAVLSPEVVAYYRAMYDSELRCLDDAIGQFFAGLKELGLADQVTVIITADHGEEFTEHGKMAHEQVYNETLHVPLLVALPGATAGHRVERVVQSIDLAPTLYDLAGVQAPAGLPGRSLVPLLVDPRAESGGEAFSRSISGDRCLYSLGPDGLLHVVSLRPAAGRDDAPLAVATSVQLWDPPPPNLPLEARSYREPARLRVELDGRLLQEVDLQPEAWSRFEVAVPPDWLSHTLRLSSVSCLPSPPGSPEGTPPCLSFYVKGLPQRRTELFRTDADRQECRDLSGPLADRQRYLLGRLGEYSFGPTRPAGEKPLEPEVEEQLRALGYIR